MADPSPSEFVNGRHWADVLGCDMRAQAPEIRRAASRRTAEAMDKLSGETLSKRLIEIGEATEIAVRARAQPRRNRRGSFAKAEEK